MDKSTFGQIVTSPADITPEQLAALRRVRDEYPYCAPAQVLMLMADKAGSVPLWEVQSLPRVMLYMMETDWLKEQLSREDSRQGLAGDASQTSHSPNPQQAAAETADYDILKEINAYQEVSFKTAPKSVILSNFLEKDGGIVLDADSFEEVPVQELAKKSIQPNDSLATETMAVMLMKQGKIDRAIAIYKKLMSKYPEKSSIFAARIAEAEALVATSEKERENKVII